MLLVTAFSLSFFDCWVATWAFNELLLTALEEALLTISDESDFSFLMDDGKLHFF